MSQLTEEEREFLRGIDGYLCARGFAEWSEKLSAIIDRLTTPSEPPAEQAAISPPVNMETVQEKAQQVVYEYSVNQHWNQRDWKLMFAKEVVRLSTPTTPPPGELTRDALAKWYFGFAFKSEPETWEYFQPHEWGEYEAADECYRFADLLTAALPGIGGQQARQGVIDEKALAKWLRDNHGLVIPVSSLTWDQIDEKARSDWYSQARRLLSSGLIQSAPTQERVDDYSILSDAMSDIQDMDTSLSDFAKHILRLFDVYEKGAPSATPAGAEKEG